MKGIGKCLCTLIGLLALLAALAGIGLYFAYQVIDEGELNLPNAPGVAAIVREKDTGIAHIRGDSYLSVVYA